MLSFLQRTHRSDLLRDFYALYVKRRGSAQGSAFLGLENWNIIFNVFIRKNQKNTMAPMGKIKQFFRRS